MSHNTLKRHTWNAICDQCGFKFKADQLIKRWDGLMVCKQDWEPRHPQDFIKAVKEPSQNLPWTRTDQDGVNVGPNYTTLYITEGYFEKISGNPPQTYFVEL